MILVDTSVWVRALAGIEPYKTELDRLLDIQEVGGHPFVYGELLIGDPGGRHKLLSSYELIEQARVVAHQEVVAFSRYRRLHGRGLSWMDVHLLASAIVDRMQLWTADTRSSAVAEELGLAHRF
jgi:predicted nucleic acid-binding protein